MLPSRTSPPSVACATFDASTTTRGLLFTWRRGIRWFRKRLAERPRLVDVLLKNRHRLIDELPDLRSLRSRQRSCRVLHRRLMQRERVIHVRAVPRQAGLPRGEAVAQRRWRVIRGNARRLWRDPESLGQVDSVLSQRVVLAENHPAEI